MIRTFAICLAIACSKAFVLNDPCNIVLQIGQYRPNVTSIRSDVVVPYGCVNGTIRWGLSRGLGRVHFLNPHHRSMSVCYNDAWGWFTNGDITNESPDIPIRPTVAEFHACTTQSTAITLILELGPPESLLFIGDIYYWIKQ